MNPSDKKNNISDADLEKAISEAMKFAGWIMPETASEVLRAEKILSENVIAIPEELSIPDAILENKSKNIHFRQSNSINISIEQNIARAAREGGTISLEVLERMHKDRENAERKNNE